MAEPHDGSDGLGQFLRRAARTRLLTAAEERELARRIERGDARARERMIEANLLLVVSVAKRYRHPGIPLADLIQEGTIGLIRAVEKFDHRRGNRFSTYAVFSIRQYVARAVAEKSRLVRLPADANARLRRLQRLERDLRAQIGRAPTSAELADVARHDASRRRASAPGRGPGGLARRARRRRRRTAARGAARRRRAGSRRGPGRRRPMPSRRCSTGSRRDSDR